MMQQNEDMMRKVEAYRDAVLRYEKLHAEVNALIRAHAGESQNMSAESRARYRELARQRDEAMNDVLWLEQQLQDDEIH